MRVVVRKVAALTGQLSRLMDDLTNGTLPLETVEEPHLPLEAERKRIQAELDAVPTVPTVELHPKAVAQYHDTVERLAERLQALDDRADADLIAAFRALVHCVIVHDRADGGMEAEVISHLSALIGQDAEPWGGRVVAEEGLEPPTRGL